MNPLKINKQEYAERIKKEKNFWLDAWHDAMIVYLFNRKGLIYKQPPFAFKYPVFSPSRTKPKGI